MHTDRSARIAHDLALLLYRTIDRVFLDTASSAV